MRLYQNASAFEEECTCVLGEMHLRLKGSVLAFPERTVRRNVKKRWENRLKNGWKTCISH